MTEEATFNGLCFFLNIDGLCVVIVCFDFYTYTNSQVVCRSINQIHRARTH